MVIAKRFVGRLGRNPPSYAFYTSDNLPILRGIYANPLRYTGELEVGGKESYEKTEAGWDTNAKHLDEIKARRPDALPVIKIAGSLYGDSGAGYLTFMAVRLLEMERVMKRGGSIYLHCDTRISHLLRMMMDAVFGPENFKNELVLGVPARRAGGRRWPLAHETVLFYTGPAWHRWKRILLPREIFKWHLYSTLYIQAA